MALTVGQQGRSAGSIGEASGAAAGVRGSHSKGFFVSAEGARGACVIHKATSTREFQDHGRVTRIYFFFSIVLKPRSDSAAKY